MLCENVSINTVGNILRKTNDFAKCVIEKVLFESMYPILFTGVSGDKVFLFICHSTISTTMKWIATETTYENLISLLEDRITIREAFVNCTDTKYMITYSNGEVKCTKCLVTDIPEFILPTAGVKMNVDENEFKKEINYFKTQIRLMELELGRKSL